MKRIVAFIILFLVLVTLWGGVVGQCTKERDTKISLENVIRAQEQNIKIYQDEKKNWVTQHEVAEIRNAEAMEIMKQHDKEMLATLERINKRMKSIEYLCITAMASNYNIPAPSTKDTIVMINNESVKAQALSYQDPAGWYSFKALNVGGTIQDINFQTHDSLITSVTWKRRWLFGRKRYTQEIISLNPNSRVHYARSIIVKK